MTKFNTNAVSMEDTYEKNIMHRKAFANYLRWDYVTRYIKKGINVVDVGCGEGDLAMMIYANKLLPERYVGTDISKWAIEKAHKRVPNEHYVFLERDICEESLAPDIDFYPDVVACLEVAETIGRENLDSMLINVQDIMKANSIFLLSTPINDAWVFGDIKKELKAYFEIQEVYGTYANVNDYNDWLGHNEEVVYQKVRQYLGLDSLSVFMASLIPPHLCKNCMWVLRLKQG